MSETADEAVLDGAGASEDAPRRRGRPPKNPAEIATVADNAAAIAGVGFAAVREREVEVVISVKPSEWWRCPYVDDGAGGTRITQPREKLMVPISLARFMQKNEQAIMLEEG